jgi:regulatory protein
VTDHAPVTVPGTDARIQQGLELAYGYLNVRDRTSRELRSHLERHGVDADVADGVVRTLIDRGHLDDARFARLFAQDKRELEDWGTERIRRVLLARGIEHELVETTLGGEAGAGDLDRARELLRRRFPSPPRSRRERDRAIGVLLRKGYDSETALDALAGYRRLP